MVHCPTSFQFLLSPHSVSVLYAHTGYCHTLFRSHEWIEAKRAQLKAPRVGGEIVCSKIDDPQCQFLVNQLIADFLQPKVA